MGLGVLGIFGTIPFTCSDVQVLNFKNVRQQRRARYATHEIIGGPPVHEYIGPDQAEVSFDITLSSQYNSPPNIYIPMLETLLKMPTAQTLMLGAEYYGDYILTGFDIQRQYYTGFGVCQWATVSMQLREAAGFDLLEAATGLVSDVIDTVAGAF